SSDALGAHKIKHEGIHVNIAEALADLATKASSAWRKGAFAQLVRESSATLQDAQATREQHFNDMQVRLSTAEALANELFDFEYRSLGGSLLESQSRLTWNAGPRALWTASMLIFEIN